MADQATSNITASVFLDEVKSKMNGVCDYTPVDSGDKLSLIHISEPTRPY